MALRQSQEALAGAPGGALRPQPFVPDPAVPPHLPSPSPTSRPAVWNLTLTIPRSRAVWGTVREN